MSSTYGSGINTIILFAAIRPRADAVWLACLRVNLLGEFEIMALHDRSTHTFFGKVVRVRAALACGRAGRLIRRMTERGRSRTGGRRCG